MQRRQVATVSGAAPSSTGDESILIAETEISNETLLKDTKKLKKIEDSINENSREQKLDLKELREEENFNLIGKNDEKEELLSDTNDISIEDNEEDEDQIDRDVESLLSNHKSENHLKFVNSSNNNPCSKWKVLCCTNPYKIGNCTVLCPTLYSMTGIGIIGPHWYGFIITNFLLFSGSSYFIKKALRCACPITFGITIFLTIVCYTSLWFVGLQDPGIIKMDQQLISNKRSATDLASNGDEDQCRWCDICSVLQPSHAVHCPECNVCISQYDHHCPWMGTCIGGNNFQPFVTFNATWVFFLIFGISWIGALVHDNDVS